MVNNNQSQAVVSSLVDAPINALTNESEYKIDFNPIKNAVTEGIDNLEKSLINALENSTTPFVDRNFDKQNIIAGISNLKNTIISKIENSNIKEKFDSVDLNGDKTITAYEIAYYLASNNILKATNPLPSHEDAKKASRIILGIEAKDFFNGHPLKIDDISTTLNGDVGIPGLGLSLDITPKLTNITLDFGFGLGFTNRDIVPVSKVSEEIYINPRSGNKDEIILALDAQLSKLDADGELGFIQLNAKNTAGNTGLKAQLFVDWEDSNNNNQINAGEVSVDLDPVIEANLALTSSFDKLTQSLNIPDFLPEIKADMKFSWNPERFDVWPGFRFDQLDGKGANNNLPITLEFNNVAVNAAGLISEFAAPLVKRIQEITAPLNPFIEALNKDITLLEDLRDLTGISFDKDGNGEIDSFDLIKAFYPQVDTTLLQNFSKLIELVNDFSIPDLEGINLDEYLIKLGNFKVDGIKFTDGKLDLSDVSVEFDPNFDFYSELDRALEGLEDEVKVQRAGATSGSQATIDVPAEPIGEDVNDNVPEKSSFKYGTWLKQLGNLPGGGIEFPFLNNPFQSIVDLFAGNTFDLMTYDMPEFYASFALNQEFPVMAGVDLSLGGAITASANFDFGFDTDGLQQLAAIEDKLSNAHLILDGFYVSDPSNGDGEIPEVTINGEIRAGGEVGIGIGGFDLASAGITGGIEASLWADLVDPNKDGKVRGSELWSTLTTNPLGIFDIGGTFTAGAEAYAEYWNPFKFQQVRERLWKSDRITLYQFDTSSMSRDRQPDLATLENNNLILNIGDRADERGDIFNEDRYEEVIIEGTEASQPIAADSLRAFSAFSTSDAFAAASQLHLTPTNSVSISSLGFTQTYSGFNTITANGGKGNTIIRMSNTNASLDFYGGEGDDIIQGAAGDDTIRGGEGWNFVFGGDGADSIEGGSKSDKLYGENGTDRISGGAGSDVLFGGFGNDSISGGNDDDHVSGGAGEDVIQGGLGNDVLFGGIGNDEVTGEQGTDNIQGNLGNDTLSGGDNGDFIQGNEGDDSISGDDGDDSIEGNSGADTISGGNDNDTISGDAGADLIHGDQGDDSILAGDDNDEVYGDTGNDYLEGGNGDDNLAGAEGDDEVSSGNGNDTLTGDAGNDLLEGGDGNDAISGGDGEDVAFGGNGNDTMAGGADNDYIEGGSGDDAISGDAGDDVLNGNEGNDILRGGDGDDELYGDEGDDTLEGGAGSDLIDGGTGNNTVTYENDTAGIILNLDNKTYLNHPSADCCDTDCCDPATDLEPDFEIGAKEARDGSGSLDTLLNIRKVIASNHADVLIGDASANQFQGNGGDDILIGNAGDDALDGGAGNDTASYRRDPGSIQANFETRKVRDGFGRTDSLSSIENLIGSQHNDQILGNDQNNILLAEAGNDSVDGQEGDDRIEGGLGDDSLKGGRGNDYLSGQQGQDRLEGGEGDDQLEGGCGDDSLFGQNGNDILTGGDDKDYLDGGAGDDQLEGGCGDDELQGRDDNDTLSGGEGNDSLDGGNEDDQLSGGFGDDLLYGQDGNDILNGGIGNDSIKGGTGRDSLQGNEGDDILKGESEDDMLEGGIGNDTLEGGSENDILTGGDGDDVLDGGDGEDTLEAGEGNDRLSGGAGHDILIGGAGNDEVYAGSGNDKISGGAGQDKLYAESGDDALNGDAGNDYLNGGAGNDSIFGGAGTDELYGDIGTDTLDGGSGNDTINGGDGNDRLDGGVGDDILVGAKGNDALNGDAGDDLLTGDIGNDTINGGIGNDTVLYQTSPKGVVVNLNSISYSSETFPGWMPFTIDANTALDGFGTTDKLANLENIVASDFADTLIGSDTTNVIQGLAGDDQLIGNAGNDVINGGTGSDVINGGTGNDTLTGGGGHDRFILVHGDGIDTITEFGGIGTQEQPRPTVLAEIDTIKFEGAGFTAKNMLLTQTGSDLVISFEGVNNTQVVLQNFQMQDLDNFRPGSAPNSSALGNILFDGDTTIQDSFDVFDANWRRSQILPDLGINRVTFLNDLNNNIQGFENSDDVINGQGGNDILNGLSGNDLLRGGTGNDTLRGGAGNDILVGGAGNDVLTGGSGNDRFTLTTNGGTDIITDFTHGQDVMGLTTEITFAQLTIAQGTGANSTDTLISFNSGTNTDLLAILTGIQATTITAANFAIV